MKYLGLPETFAGVRPSALSDEPIYEKIDAVTRSIMDELGVTYEYPFYTLCNAANGHNAGMRDIPIKTSAQLARLLSDDQSEESQCGLAWADPEPDIYGIGRWILLLLPAMMGIAYTMHRELSGRQMITVHRHGSSRQWWASKVVASTLYAVICVLLMFLWTMVLGWLRGAKGMQVYVTDADGFRTAGNGVLPTMFVQFLLQVIMWTQLQMLIHLIFVDMRAGIIAFLLPLVAMLVSASNIEVMGNMWIPVNWGMVFRTEIFCSSGYMLEGGEWMSLCSISPLNAFILHAIVVACLYSLHATCSRFVELTNHSEVR